MNKLLKNYKFDKRTLYFGAILILALIYSIINITYSAFSKSLTDNVANLKVNGLNYLLTVNWEDNKIIKVDPNKTTMAFVAFSSLNDDETKYELIYDVCSDSTCETFIEKPADMDVKYSSLSLDSVNGSIGSHRSKTIKIAAVNTSSNTYYIKMSLNAGFAENTLAYRDLINSEYTEVVTAGNSDINIIAYINGEQSNDFPTTKFYDVSVVCSTNDGPSNAIGKARWNGTKWLVTITDVDAAQTNCMANFVTKPNYDTSGANEPFLADNMIPVVYDITNDAWIKTTSDDAEWYNYGERKWANAVTVKLDSRSIHVNSEPGTTIPPADILAFWVWIPRYEYRTDNLGTQYAGGTISLPGPIDIKFVSGRSTENTNNYLIHPAFRNGEVYYHSEPYDLGGWNLELTGFWMAKDSLTTNSSESGSSMNELSTIVMYKPIGYTLSRISFANIVKANSTIAASSSGIPDTLTSHTFKNDEWGAVAYLSQSIYGKYGDDELFLGEQKEVYPNNAYSVTTVTKTGISTYYRYNGKSAGTYAGDPTTTIDNYIDNGKFSYNDCPGGSSTCTLAVKQANAGKGTGASTTGNIYGIYDMVGGLYDVSYSLYASAPLADVPRHLYNLYTSNNISEACNGVPCPGVGWPNETGNGVITNNSLWYNDTMYALSLNNYFMRGSSCIRSNNIDEGIFSSSSASLSSMSSAGYALDLTSRACLSETYVAPTE